VVAGVPQIMEVQPFGADQGGACGAAGPAPAPGSAVGRACPAHAGQCSSGANIDRSGSSDRARMPVWVRHVIGVRVRRSAWCLCGCFTRF
jgi:hypothetical protein